MNGLILIDKEKNYTSRDVDNILKGILKQKKIGHTGTLDPNATGLLVCLLGKSTSYQDFFKSDKEYICELIFGKSTDTDDITGKTKQNIEKFNISFESLNSVINSFIGDIQQIPPMYSAKHINGQRLYDIARSGKEIQRKTNLVKIYDIKILDDFKFINEKNNIVRLKISCSKGCYIRSICRDIGIKLNIPTCMGDLRRTKIDDFLVENAYKISDIEKMNKNLDYSFLKPCFYLKEDSVVTFGKFETCHSGHQKIFETMIEESKSKNLDTAVIVFSFANSNSMYTLDERYNFIHNLGINNIFRVEFDDYIKNIEAEYFIEEILINQMKAKSIVVGMDCSFGKNRKGNTDLLKFYCDKYNITLHVLPKKTTDFNGKTVNISSTLIKNLLSNGCFEQASSLLKHKI